MSKFLPRTRFVQYSALEMGLNFQQRLQRYFYNTTSGWVDGTTEFHVLISGVFDGRGEILEIGAGPTNPTTRYLASLAKIHGIDPDPVVKTNEDLHTATVMTGNTYPILSESISLCVSDYVVEHIDDPLVHLKEVRRVLQPGGAYIFRTVNKWHYVAIGSRLTPQWFHELVANRLRALPASHHEPYRTVYRMNTVEEISRGAVATGLEVEKISYVEKDPYYGRFSGLVFLILTAYERLVNSARVFRPLRANFFVVLRKPRSPC